MRLPLSLVLCLSIVTAPARAGGIPVIDVANLAQAVQQVMNEIASINNQVQQIRQLQQQIDSLNGRRQLGEILDNPALSNYVPAEAYTWLAEVDRAGYAGLSGTGRSLRDAAMIYNCADRGGRDRLSCQAGLARPYQHKGLVQDAMQAAAGRLVQIRSLMRQINSTDDQKSIQELQARIGAENALLAHEMSQLQMLQGLADSEERIARSRDRERQYEMLNRRGKVADYLP